MAGAPLCWLPLFCIPKMTHFRYEGKSGLCRDGCSSRWQGQSKGREPFTATTTPKVARLVWQSSPRQRHPAPRDRTEKPLAPAYMENLMFKSVYNRLGSLDEQNPLPSMKSSNVGYSEQEFELS